MSEWKAKRFWKDVTVVPLDAGFAIELDGRRVKTPAKRDLLVPTLGFADAIAAEWAVQEGVIDPVSMPFTRSANAALDKVALQMPEVAEMLAAYGDSDLLCYRADAPEELNARQSQQWDPLLDWVRAVMGIDLQTVEGVMYAPQDPSALKTARAHVDRMDAFQLTGFHDLVSLSGSLIIAFAAVADLHPIDDLWEISILDDLWQQEQWGKDDLAEETRAKKQTSFKHAKRVYDLSQ